MLLYNKYHIAINAVIILVICLTFFLFFFFFLLRLTIASIFKSQVGNLKERIQSSGGGVLGKMYDLPKPFKLYTSPLDN